MILSIGLYSCTKEIPAHTKISDTSVSVTMQNSHAYFKYKNTSEGIDWNVAIMVSTNFPGKTSRIPVVKKLIRNIRVIKEHFKKTLLEIIRTLFMLYQLILHNTSCYSKSQIVNFKRYGMTAPAIG